MRIVLLTLNAIRHKFVANTLAARADRLLVVSECRQNDAVAVESLGKGATLVEKHFYERYLAERKFFAGNDVFHAPTIPLLHKEVNLRYTYDAVASFKPEAIFVFGASIIKEPLLSVVPPGRRINMHLGLSPYYRGSGTNFWPFANGELEYVGATLLHLDAGVDSGDIVAHVRPGIEPGDTVHTAGCKTIRGGADAFVRCIARLEKGLELPRVKQWEVPNARYYRRKDVTPEALARYHENMRSGLVQRYAAEGPKRDLRLIPLPV